MGLFARLKDMFREKDYTAMTSKELFKLDDIELEVAVSERLYKKYGYYTKYGYEVKNTQKNILQNATETQKIYYVLHRYDMMISLNEKHGEYSLEKNQMIIPQLIPAMEKIGATENKELLLRYADKYNLYLDNLNIEQFHRLNKIKNENNQSPVEEFEEAYYELMEENDELDACLMIYIRQHMEEV